jgi:hypothetical protein
MPETLIKESDARISLIQSLSIEFDGFEQGELPIEDMIAKAKLLVSLYEQERLWLMIEQAYRILALSYVKAGRTWNAMKWIMKATDAYILSEGTRNTMINDIERMIRKPPRVMK